MALYTIAAERKQIVAMVDVEMLALRDCRACLELVRKIGRSLALGPTRTHAASHNLPRLPVHGGLFTLM